MHRTMALAEGAATSSGTQGDSALGGEKKEMKQVDGKTSTWESAVWRWVKKEFEELSQKPPIDRKRWCVWDDFEDEYMQILLDCNFVNHQIASKL